MPTGEYTWTLRAVPADGSTPLVTSGSLWASYGDEVFRDYYGNGAPSVLVLTKARRLDVRLGEENGTFHSVVDPSPAVWPAGATFVPFGDLRRNNCNDLLMRTADGALRVYNGNCEGYGFYYPSASTALGTGWNQFDILTSPGDVTGDGRPDLVGRQKTTGDMYLYRATSTGTLAAKTRIHTRWGLYKRIVGVGDLNGDGHGDLLAQDRANQLWRYYGTGTGRFSARVLIGTNWGVSYNAVVGIGDLNRDGRNDLLARDGAGNLWRYDGDGKGRFRARTRIATGWQVYASVL